MRAAVVAIAVCASSLRAAADPTLIAIVAAPDAAHAIAIGRAGEVYEPDATGWVRRTAGGVSVALVVAARAGATIIAGGTDTAAFRFQRGVWHLLAIGYHAKPLLGAGSRATCAIGRAVYTLDREPAVKLPDAPTPVIRLAASSAGVAIETERGVFRRGRTGKWQAIAGSPRHVDRLVSDRWAIVGRAAIDLTTGATTGPLGPFEAVTATDAGVLLVASEAGGKLVIRTFAGKKRLETSTVVSPASPIAGIAADDDGKRLVVALRDGRILARGRDGAWSTTTVREQLPPGHPGAPPATSQQ